MQFLLNGLEPCLETIDKFPFSTKSGELTNEEDVLEWLISNKSSGDDENEEIEAVSAKALWTLVDSIDHLAVLFLDSSPLSEAALKDLENIDDDCSREGIEFVKTDDKKAAKEFGVETVPSLVYFEQQIPNLYDGDLRDEDDVLKWLLHQKDSDEIEDVTSEMLSRLVKGCAETFFFEEEGKRANFFCQLVFREEKLGCFVLR